VHPEIMRAIAEQQNADRIRQAERRHAAAQVPRAPGRVRRFLNAFGRMLIESGALSYDTVGSYPDEEENA
jgi:hypothetical protein